MLSPAALISAFTPVLLGIALAPSTALAQDGNFFVGCWSVDGSPNARCCQDYTSLPGGNYTGFHCSGASVSEDSSILYCPTPNYYKDGAIWPACCQKVAPSNMTALDGMGYQCTLEGNSKNQVWP
ncbi:hypothetical protein F5Y12DRAFT_769882 [Xylaria sp. FL1777]|nr:hypothetical protein F5Y12DRAFT_769882 [Xylaria sp. FL1777]